MTKSEAIASKTRPGQAQVTVQEVESRMITLRNQPVLIDSDVAVLYGVQTKEVNQAVRNNPQKFPYGYIFELDKYEKAEVVKKIDRLNKLKFSSVAPTAFTERGLYMLATILKGDKALSTSLAIIDTFVQVRELARTMESLQTVEDGGVQQRTLHLHSDLQRILASWPNETSHEKDKSATLDQFYGVWSDGQIDADAFIAELKSARTFKRETIE